MAKGKGFGGGMPHNQANMMRQVQKMQADMMKMQDELETTEYEAKAGGGMVRAVVNGKKELTVLEIDPEAVDPDDVEMLQDMVLAAVNEAIRTSESAAAERMNALTGGLNLGF